MLKHQRGVLAALVILVALGMAACGGESSTGPSKTTIASGQFTNLAPMLVDLWSSSHYAPFTVPSDGRIEVEVDWGSSNNDVDINLLQGRCGSLDFCESLGGTSSLTNKPERLSMTVAPGQYTLEIKNWGPGRESGDWFVDFDPDK